MWVNDLGDTLRLEFNRGGPAREDGTLLLREIMIMIMAATSIVSPLCPAGSLALGTQGLILLAPLRGRCGYHPRFIREESGETHRQSVVNGFEPQRTGPKVHSQSTAALCLPAPGTEEAKVTPPGGPRGSRRV